MKVKEKESLEETKKESKFFSGILGKTVDISKKTASSVQKGTKALVEQTKKSLHDKKVKKYNPLFPEDFRKEDFHLPNVIEIVDDAIRRDIDICEGAIGWIDKVNEVEILHLYDEWVEQSGIQFVPIWKCDNIYCVDNFDRTKYINSNAIYGKATEEKLAELENIAYCLGAKYCSIELVEEDSEASSQSMDIKKSAKGKNNNGGGEVKASSVHKMHNTQKGKTVSNFNGHDNPTRPALKWFAYDDNINGLIEKRCNDISSIKSKVLALSGACSATMNKKVACAIDKILKVSGKMSMEQQAVKEYSSTLVFEVEF